MEQTNYIPMKKFLIRIISFTMLVTLITLLIIEISYGVIKNKADFKLKTNVKYLMLGHSHAQCTYDDLFITNFKNVASSGEAYFYTYPKIENIMAQNPNLKVIFIEFTNNQVTKKMDEWIWDDQNLSYNYSSYAPFLKQADHELLLKNNKIGYLHSLSLTFRKQLVRVLTGNYNYISGGYLYLDRNMDDSASRKDANNLKEIDSLSRYSIIYLKKIVALCLKNKKKIYLVRSPQHKDYLGRRNEETFNKIRIENFPQIEFLDFNYFPLQNSEFADYGHLNYRGAKKFSIWFDALLKENLLGKKNKQQFINESIQKSNGVLTARKDKKIGQHQHNAELPYSIPPMFPKFN